MNDFNENGKLSNEILEKGARALTAFQRNMTNHEVKTINAVATEVFRKSPNGQDAIKRFEDLFGSQISIISQEEEAQLAFLGAIGISGINPESIVVWDCGAGSF